MIQQVVTRELVNFKYCEKATKFQSISHFFLTILSNGKKRKIESICVAFSEYLNFNQLQRMILPSHFKFVDVFVIRFC
jgi:hypothetical protein